MLLSVNGKRMDLLEKDHPVGKAYRDVIEALKSQGKAFVNIDFTEDHYSEEEYSDGSKRKKVVGAVTIPTSETYILNGEAYDVKLFESQKGDQYLPAYYMFDRKRSFNYITHSADIFFLLCVSKHAEQVPLHGDVSEVVAKYQNAQKGRAHIKMDDTTIKEKAIAEENRLLAKADNLIYSEQITEERMRILAGSYGVPVDPNSSYDTVLNRMKAFFHSRDKRGVLFNKSALIDFVDENKKRKGDDELKAMINEAIAIGIIKATEPFGPQKSHQWKIFDSEDKVVSKIVEYNPTGDPKRQLIDYLMANADAVQKIKEHMVVQ